MNSKTEKFWAGVVAVIALFSIVSMFYFSWSSPSSSSEPTKAHDPSAIELYAQAQGFVRQGLKAPSTAKFPLEPVSVGTDGNGLYQVESYVDSQNGFGAMIRSHWMLNMRPVGDEWMLETMQIDGKIVYDIAQRE